eukprot:4903169-Heterocapsa_arctica.AAC.1
MCAETASARRSVLSLPPRWTRACAAAQALELTFSPFHPVSEPNDSLSSILSDQRWSGKVADIFWNRRACRSKREISSSFGGRLNSR